MAIGKPLERKEDDRLLTGNGRFTDDFSLPGQVYAAMVRSPYPHAVIKKISVGTSPGLIAVFTGADCAADLLKPIPHNPLPSTRDDMKLNGPGGGAVPLDAHLLLPIDKARHVGEAVAMVVAATREQALDAAEAMQVEYEELPWVAHSVDAMKAGAPAVWDEVPDNVLIDTWFGDREATERAFGAAYEVVEAEYFIPRVSACAMEPRSALGAFDGNRYTLRAGSGGAVRQKGELAAVLGVDPSTVRVISADVGGNFGSRNRVYVEYGLVLWASRKLGRPVKYTATRSEALISDYQGRDLVTTVELALRKDGKFLALRASNVSNVGAHCVSLSPLSKGSGLITGSYDIPAATLRSRAVFTNTMSTNAYRSSGRPEVTLAIERLIDKAADQLGFDPIELRRQNLVRPEAMPYRNAVGMTYDSGTYEANMDLAMKLADGGDNFRERRMAAAARGRRLGLGLANYVESSIGNPRERADIAVLPEGRVRVVIGTQPAGQGHETAFAQVISQLMSIPTGAVDVVLGDTDVVSAGGGTHSGRSMRHAATVFSKAMEPLLEKGRQLVAFLDECPVSDVQFVDGVFKGERSFSWFELARAAAAAILPAELRGGLAVVTDNEMHDPVFPNGCAVCECEVDAETGAVEITRYASVDDVGRCINPLIVDGQTHGAIAQGIGEAMWELCHLDPASGQPLAGSLMDYALPRADMLPSFRTEIVEVLSPTNPLGIKAGGEGGTTPALAAVTSAIVDALWDFGVREIEMPVTAYRVWKAIQEAGK